MKEGAPKRHINKLKKEIGKLEEQEKNPGLEIHDRRSLAPESTPQPDIESEILSREAKIRELEILKKEAGEELKRKKSEKVPEPVVEASPTPDPAPEQPQPSAKKPWSLGGISRDNLWRELQDLYPNKGLSTHPEVFSRYQDLVGKMEQAVASKDEEEHAKMLDVGEEIDIFMNEQRAAVAEAEQRAAAAERNGNTAPEVAKTEVGTPQTPAPALEEQSLEKKSNILWTDLQTPEQLDTFFAEQDAVIRAREKISPETDRQGTPPPPLLWTEQPEETSPLPTEATPAETRGRLRQLIEKLTGGSKEKETKDTSGARAIFGNLDGDAKVEKPVATRESGARAEKLGNYLNNRSGELDEKAEGFGPKIEKMFHSMGEKYNKLNWKYKLAIGVALGVGVGISAGISAPVTALFAAGIGVQRALGLAGMYVKFDKHLEKTVKGEGGGLGKYEWYKKLFENKSEGQRKAIALAMAGVCFVGTSAAVGAIAGETSHILTTHGWLGHQLGHAANPNANPNAGANAAPAAGHEGLVSPDHASEAPTLSVEASHGHGYEFMAKRLWEQMHDPAKHFSPPPNTDPNSDVARLFSADAHSIDKVVHQIAADPKHGFFNPDGTSIRIDPTAHMTIGADGNIHLGTDVHSIPGAHTTPVYNPHAPTTHEATTTTPHTEAPTATTAEAPNSPAEPTPPHNAPVAPHQSISENESVIAAKNYASHHPAGAHTPAPAGAEHAAHQPVVLHHHGINIPTGESHVYADSHKHLFIYGGSHEQQMHEINKFLNIDEAHQKMVVYGTDDSGKYRIPWTMNGGQMVPSMPVQTKGFLHTGFLKSFMKAPEPKEFHKIIQ